MDKIQVNFDECFYQGIIESSPGGMVLTDKDGSMLLVNEAIEKIFGFNRDEILFKPVEILFPERFRKAILHERELAFLKITSRPKKPSTEFWGLRKDGTEFPQEIGVKSLILDGDKFTIFSIVDFTEHKKAQELFHQLVESSSIAMLIADDSGKISLMNKAAGQMFGYTRNEMLNMAVEDLVPFKHRKAHVQHRLKFQHDQVSRPMGHGRDLSGVRKDGSEILVEVGLNHLEFEGRKFTLASIMDISERKRNELIIAQQAEELARSNKELEQFAYIASHDLQEPLRKMVSFSQLFSQTFSGKIDDEPKEYLDYIVKGAQRMSALIQDLLQYSRVGQVELEFETTDLNTVIKEVLANLETAINEHKAVIVHDDLPVLKAHKTFIAVVFQNLISNALKFHGTDTPQVNISAQEKDQEWEFTVSDNGIGIDPKFINKLFVIFQRLHSKSEYSGSGIGLALCKRMIERHDGRIWIEPHNGPGTVFKFTLPIRV